MQVRGADGTVSYQMRGALKVPGTLTEGEAMAVYKKPRLGVEEEKEEGEEEAEEEAEEEQEEEQEEEVEDVGRVSEAKSGSWGRGGRGTGGGGGRGRGADGCAGVGASGGDQGAGFLLRVVGQEGGRYQGRYRGVYLRMREALVSRYLNDQLAISFPPPPPPPPPVPTPPPPHHQPQPEAASARTRRNRARTRRNSSASVPIAQEKEGGGGGGGGGGGAERSWALMEGSSNLSRALSHALSSNHSSIGVNVVVLLLGYRQALFLDTRFEYFT